jgi:hypothetical protein
VPWLVCASHLPPRFTNTELIIPCAPVMAGWSLVAGTATENRTMSTPAAGANGGSDEGAPGTRAYYSPTFFVTYVRDPNGNKLAAAFDTYAAEE